MLLVAGVNLRNPVPRFWDKEDVHYVPGIKALMVSFAEFLGFKARLEAVRRVGLRKYLRIPTEYQIYVDNGAFHTLTHGMQFDSKSYRSFVEEARPDWYPIPVEHIPHPSMPGTKQKALYRATMLYNHRYAKNGYVPVVHAGACLPKFLDGIDRIAKKTPITRLGLGAMVPFLLRSKGAQGKSQIVDDILAVRRRLPSVRIHGFGIGGTSTLHIASVLGLDSIDSSGWRNRAARGIIQLRGTGDRIVADFGKWRGRALSLTERRALRECECPSCAKNGPAALETGQLPGFAARATHNLFVLAEELREIEQRLETFSYLPWYREHINNKLFMGLIDRAIAGSGLTIPTTRAPEARAR